MLEHIVLPASTADKLLNNVDELIPIVANIMGCSIAIIAIVSGVIQKSLQTKQYEESSREIAA